MHRNKTQKTQNLWNSVKRVLRGRFIAIQAYHKKQEEKGTTEDEMAGWHHRLDGCEFE